MPNLNAKPLLIIRESVKAKVIWLIVFVSILTLSLGFALKKNFPLPVLILGAGSLFLIICIQLALLKKAISNDNWLLKFFSDGLLIQTTGYIPYQNSSWIYVPRSAIRQVNVDTEKRCTSQLDVNNIQKITLLQRFIFLNIHVDHNHTLNLSPDADTEKYNGKRAPSAKQRQNNRLEKLTTPHQQAGFTMFFIFNPVIATDFGFQIELRSHRTRTTASLKQLAWHFQQWGILLTTHNVFVELSSKVSEDLFRQEIRRICQQGFEMEARAAIRLRYKDQGCDTTAKLEEILSDTSS
ncbi:hypothetical protein [Arsukibacterium sp.]|uniref:hypothetical protein n=1 Tax=Arsukibacterium sp. TaxID=1977258 RepID=UPI002FDB25A5